MRPVTRLLVAGALLALVFLSGIHYASAEDDHWPYPDPIDLKTAPDEYAGERVFLFGTVEEIDETTETARLRIDSRTGPFTVTVTGFDTKRDVQPGGVVQVVGEFQSDRSVVADTTRVVNPAGSSNAYKYAVSGIAAVFILVLFFRYWRVNLSTLSFEVRYDG